MTQHRQRRGVVVHDADGRTLDEQIVAAREMLARQSLANLPSLVEQLRVIKAVLEEHHLNFSARMIDQVSSIQYNTINRDEDAAHYFRENSTALRRKPQRGAHAPKAVEHARKDKLTSYSQEHLITLVRSQERQIQDQKAQLITEQVAHKETTNLLARTRAAFVERRNEIEHLQAQVAELTQYREKCQAMEEFLAKYLPNQSTED